MQLRSRTKFEEDPESPFPFTMYLLLDPEYGFYKEDYFNERLCFETKRTERSKKSFLMMLLNIEKILPVDERKQVIKKIKSILSSSTV